MNTMNEKNLIAPVERRSAALKDLLQEKGVAPEGTLEAFMETVEEWNPKNGADVVAKAWLEPDFKERLRKDATSACAELGYEGPQGEYMFMLENTPKLQNVIVCTLCSCTAWPILGFPPDWYKSPEYRARLVRNSRSVLRELGLDLPNDVEIRVTDTNAETRFFVLPERPPETEGWTHEQLASIVSREALVGIARVTAN